MEYASERTHSNKNSLASNQIKSLLLSHHHSTSALVSEILMSVLQTVQKTTIYIWTVHIYRLYRRKCAKYTYIYSVHIVYYKDIAVKRVLDFRFSPPLTLKMFRQKETPINYYTAIILSYRNVAKHLWREPQIIKFENAFHICINIGYICERTLSAMSRVKSRFRARLTDCNLQSQLHCAVTLFEQNFTKFKIFIRHIHNYTEYI